MIEGLAYLFLIVLALFLVMAYFNIFKIKRSFEFKSFKEIKESGFFDIELKYINASGKEYGFKSKKVKKKD